MGTHAFSFSRGSAPPRLAIVPLTQGEGAERRKALGCSGTRRRASDVGPRALARRPASQRGCSPLGAPLRRLLAPSPPWRNRRTVHMSGALRSHIGAFARSARSGGRAGFPGSLPSVCCINRPAGRRPHPAQAMPRESTLAGGTVWTMVLKRNKVKRRIS